MKKSSPVRASHVNEGTSIPREELAAVTTRGRVLRHPKLRADTEEGAMTPYGGLALAQGLVRRLGLHRDLDKSLSLLHSHRPYTESDHVLTHAYNLFVGGGCIEDVANLQTSEPVRRILGAARIPDPTTAGDFLRRFRRADIRELDAVVDRAQQQVWRQKHGRRKPKLEMVDVDGHLHQVYGDKKQGTDFCRKGFLAYHPLVISLAGTQECLRIVNRPGNAPDARDAAKHLREVLPMVANRFQEVVVRGDSKFFDHNVLEACEESGCHFAVVAGANPSFCEWADSLPETAWKPFQTRQARACKASPAVKRRRTRRANRRRQCVRKHNKRDLRLRRQWLAEIGYQPARCEGTYRLIMRRQLIDEDDGQGRLFEMWRYRFVLTDLRNRSAQEVVDLTYERCDQENVIEQLQNGIAGMRMPTGSFMANAAYLVCARLAHNMKSWLAQLALPKETVRWEWKRFRLAFVVVAAKVIKRARHIWVRFATGHRFVADILAAHARLQI